MTEKVNPENDPRRIRLSKVDAKPKSYRQLCMVVRFGSYQGLCPFRASKLIGDTAEAHGETRTISFLMPFDSEKVVGDVLLLPTNEDSPDNLKVEWRKSGKEAVVDMIKLLAYRKTTIPENSNMIIELYPEMDPIYEEVIGMKFVGATFEEQKERPKKSSPATQPGTGTQTTPGTQGTQGTLGTQGTQGATGGQNTAAGSMGQTPPPAKDDTGNKG